MYHIGGQGPPQDPAEATTASYSTICDTNHAVNCDRVPNVLTLLTAWV